MEPEAKAALYKMHHRALKTTLGKLHAIQTITTRQGIRIMLVCNTVLKMLPTLEVRSNF